MIAHGFGDAGGVTVRHGIGGFGGDVPGRKARAAGGQDEVELPAVGQPVKLGLEGVEIVRQKQRFFHDVARRLKHLRRQRAALVLALAAAALVGQGDDGSPQGRVLQRGQERDLVADMDLAAVQHPRKYALAGHDAFAGLLFDDAVVVALFADLGHLEHDVADGKPAGDGQGAEIKPFDDQIFAECAVIDPNFLPELRDLFGAEQADLTMPVPAVRVADDAPFRGQNGVVHRRFGSPALGAGADGQKFSHSYPPIRYIPRVAGREVRSKWCSGGLFQMVSRMACNRVSSEAPPRRSARRSQPASLARQGRKKP